MYLYVMVCVALQKPLLAEGAKDIGELNFAGSGAPKSMDPLWGLVPNGIVKATRGCLILSSRARV